MDARSVPLSFLRASPDWAIFQAGSSTTTVTERELSPYGIVDVCIGYGLDWRGC